MPRNKKYTYSGYKKRYIGKRGSFSWRTRQTSYTSNCKLPSIYTAIVAEKPKAGEKIAHALGDPIKCRYNNIPYWIVKHNGSTLLILPSAGHLFGPYSGSRGFPIFDYEWKPIHEFDKSMRHLIKFFKLMEKFLPGASLYINACDYDIEGSVIGYTIIEYFGDIRKYKRMKFSSLSPLELRQAYKNLQPPDTLLVEAGKARHEVDWLWGINVSRALMHAARTFSGKRIILSAGRVQSPTLSEAVKRWIAINLSVPLPTFILTIILNYNNIRFKAYPDGWKPETRNEAQEVILLLRKTRKLKVINIKSDKMQIKPPPAFNLGDLQKEAARLYKFSPFKTQKIAEDLYLEALISYPRTNSQKLPSTINYKTIIQKLSREGPFTSLALNLLNETRGILQPVQGKKDDPAHPAIHPTGTPPPKGLDKDHMAVYELILRRFLAAFSTSAIVHRIYVTLIDVENRRYSSKGVTILKEGWFKYYPYLRPSEEEIPPLSKGVEISIEKAGFQTKWERKAPSLSRTSLLKWMESVNIGTEATRARIIEVLFKRGYLKSIGGRTIVTDLGFMVASILEELFPQLTKVELTRKLEEKLEKIRIGESTRENVVRESREILEELINEYRRRLNYVGEKIAIAAGFEKPSSKCVICGREAITEKPVSLCRFHYEAVERIKNSLDTISYKLSTGRDEALRGLTRLRGSAGKWVIEAADLAAREPIVYDYVVSKS